RFHPAPSGFDRLADEASQFLQELIRIFLCDTGGNRCCDDVDAVNLARPIRRRADTSMRAEGVRPISEVLIDEPAVPESMQPLKHLLAEHRRRLIDEILGWRLIRIPIHRLREEPCDMPLQISDEFRNGAQA